MVVTASPSLVSRPSLTASGDWALVTNHLGGDLACFNSRREGWGDSMGAGKFQNKEAKAVERRRLDLSKPSPKIKRRRGEEKR